MVHDVCVFVDIVEDYLRISLRFAFAGWANWNSIIVHRRPTAQIRYPYLLKIVEIWWRIYLISWSIGSVLLSWTLNSMYTRGIKRALGFLSKSKWNVSSPTWAGHGHGHGLYQVTTPCAWALGQYPIFSRILCILRYYHSIRSVSVRLNRRSNSCTDRLEQENKQKDQKQLIEKLQRTVKMLESKERAQENQLKGYRYCVGKRFNTRSEKNKIFWGRGKTGITEDAEFE